MDFLLQSPSASPPLSSTPVKQKPQPLFIPVSHLVIPQSPIVDVRERTPMTSPPNSPQYASIHGSVHPTPVSSDNEKDDEFDTAYRTTSRSVLRQCFGRRCAKLNVFISKDLTRDYMPWIEQQFPDAIAFYYFINMSIGMQWNDEQMYMFDTVNGPLILVNVELNHKDTNEMLYGVIVGNDEHRIGRSYNSESGAKWQWKLEGLATMAMLDDLFGILSNELPMPSRRMHLFVRQLEVQCEMRIPAWIVDDADFWDTKLIHLRPEKTGKKRNRKNRWNDLDEVWLTKRMPAWKRMVRREWDASPAMPIVVNGRDKTHWIEWIKFVQLPNQEYIGVANKWLPKHQIWCVTAVCMDRVDVENKHRLLTSTSYLNLDQFRPYLDRFNSTYTGVQWV